jgi:uncharacterized protein YcnI
MGIADCGMKKRRDVDGGGWRWQVRVALSVGLLAGLLVTSVWGHIDLAPRESIPKRWETYTLNVPTETTSPTVKIHLRVPPAFEIETVEHSQTWQIHSVRDERGYIRELTWSGGRIPPQTFVELKFLARNPAEAGTYRWEMTQYYLEGEPSTWTAQTQIVPPASMGSQRAEEAWRAAQGATTISFIAIGMSITLIIMTVINILQSGGRQGRGPEA